MKKYNFWYDVIEKEGEIHIIDGKDTTVFCSIYAQPLEDEDYAKAKLICDAVNCYQPFLATGSEWKPPKPIVIDDTPNLLEALKEATQYIWNNRYFSELRSKETSIDYAKSMADNDSTVIKYKKIIKNYEALNQ